MSLIELNNLSVAYGSHKVLRDVSLTINQGEILTVVGPNGSGKTTLFRVLSQILAIVGLMAVVGHSYPARAANCLNEH